MAAIIVGDTLQNGAFNVIARVVGAAGDPVTIATLTDISYQVRNTNSSVKTIDTTVLTIANVVFDSLRIDDLWVVDAFGYNFLLTVPGTGIPSLDPHQIDISFTPITGEKFLVSAKTTPLATFFDG